MTYMRALNFQGTFWTDEKKQSLRDLCAGKKHTYSEIAVILGTTRSAVSGQVSRLKLKNREAPEPMNYNIKLKKQSAYDVDKWFRERTPAVSEPKPWIERKFGQCAFPLDVDNETYSCCKPSGIKTYCEEHCAVMYENWKPARPRPPQLKTDGRFA